MSHHAVVSLSRVGIALLAGSLLLVAGCAREQPKPVVEINADGETASYPADASGSILGNKDITLNASGHPKATLTARGDFVLDGNPVDLTPEQRALLLAYRGEVDGIARKGIEIGKHGAAFGMRTATTAITGALFGDNAETQARIEAEAERFKQQALAICDNVAAMQQAQDRLATALPAFAPYADMDISDVEDCRNSDSDSRNAVVDDGATAPASADAPDRNAGTNAAAEADAAAESTTTH